ncbi:N-acetylglucosamine-6-phosphate deacetylase [Thermobacillus composti KWC4]|uniref:N-acetylglucosamine-6-phosphate deacetylase n=1 Tax=Thermobacillus composti (strain DSM 18247 / JCM 13945 / KWC4) TaxID=717605 RepID=L0EC96_THECK|nr:N-acetylglucosamine-6-phosphate deacetylase [Thermobacillus composti]AGA57407.1 N-acetylglucosamine-6-phosphate deacetylase [Thermobacillus composti KWC4]
MNGILIENARIVAEKGEPFSGWILLEDGIIAAMGGADKPLPPEAASAVRVDGEGGWVLPGFIDLHVHGGAGGDFMDADEASLRAITRFHALHGTTGMLATTLTASKERLDAAIEAVSRFTASPMPHAQLLGVHLEGPFVSFKWRGAQNPDHILPPRLDWLEDWTSRWPGLIKIQTLAPETEGALEYIGRLKACGIVPACGHTDATLADMRAAADRGLRHAVHMFNAMRPYHHREPGTVGAVLTDDRIMAEVIADGHHVHPAGIEMLIRAKGPRGVILITDAMAAAGMPDGEYDLGGLSVIMQDGVARLRDSGNLAGSTLTMIDAFRFVVRKAGVSVADASRMASLNPARQIGVDRVTGSLAPGKQADVLLLDAGLGLRRVWIKGQELAP